MITVKKYDYTLEFDEVYGKIHSLVKNEKEYIGVETPVFKIGLRDDDGKLTTCDSDDFSLISSEESENNFICTYGNNETSVVVKAEFTDEIKWYITLKAPETLVAEWVDFPRITVPSDLKDNNGTSKILWGFNEGVVVDNLSFREKNWFKYEEPSYPSRGTMGIYPAIVETQFMAYYNEKGGMYFASHDNKDYLKGIDFYSYNGGILLQFRHYCGVNFNEEYTMDYPMVVKFFEGEWQDACEIYRNWFEENKKETFIPISKRSDLPAWYSEIPVIITYPVRGLHDMDTMTPNKLFPYMNAMKHVERLEKEFGCKVMVLLMHWEGTAPWAPPYVWPPYGGEECLKEFIDALHKRGDVLGVYCSGLGWSQQSNLIEEYNMEKFFDENNLKDVMCLSPEQELPYCNICQAQRKGYDMCPSQSFPTEVLKEQVRLMAESGIDYIQVLDQNHGGTPYFCYSKNHGHPPVPGKWQVDAMIKLLDEIKCKNILFGCESAAAESYIPNLLLSDNRYNLNLITGQAVPAYAYIFHQYVNNFMGNQVCTQAFIDYEKTPNSLLDRIAHSFVAGDLLTVVLNQEGEITWNWGQDPTITPPNQENVKELIKNLAMWRKFANKYLHMGKMVKPWNTECGNCEIFYVTGGMINVDEFEDGKKEIPVIYTSAWISDNGEMAQFMVNHTTDDKKCTVKLPEGTYKVYYNETASDEISGGNVELEVKALSAMMLEKLS